MNIVCLLKGHDWKLESEFMSLNKGLFRCKRCRILRERDL